MSIDLTKLSPPPWVANGCEVRGPDEPCGPMVIFDEGGHSEVEAAFIAIARNAFDVMMRRGWSPEGQDDEWAVSEPDERTGAGTVCSSNPIGGKTWPDPFTALVEADKWYAANVEAIVTPPATSAPAAASPDAAP